MPPTLAAGPLQSTNVMAFGVTRDALKCRAFYQDLLGLRFIEEDQYALVFDSGGTIIRIQKMSDHQAKRYTILGWRTPDIRATVSRLSAAGVKIERFEWMKIQDDSGVATFPNGDMVAWFKDPDENILGVAQLVNRLP